MSHDFSVVSCMEIFSAFSIRFLVKLVYTCTNTSSLTLLLHISGWVDAYETFFLDLVSFMRVMVKPSGQIMHIYTNHACGPELTLHSKK